MTDAPIQLTSTGDLKDRRLKKSSRRTTRRVLTVTLVGGVLLCIIAPMLLIALFGFNTPPSWMTSPVEQYEYKITSRLALSTFVLFVTIIGMTWLLGVVGSVAGGTVLGGGSRSLRQRLGIAGRRMAIITALAVWLRVALLAVLGIAALYAYTSTLGRPVQTGLPNTIEQALGTRIASLVLVGVIVVCWLIAPILRARYSIALGALAATFTSGRTERVSFALGARFGMELVGTLGALWGLTSFILLVLSIVDPSSYRASLPLPTESVDIVGVPLVLIAITAFAVLYAIGQIVLAALYRGLAAGRMRTKQKAALEAAG